MQQVQQSHSTGELSSQSVASELKNPPFEFRRSQTARGMSPLRLLFSVWKVWMFVKAESSDGMAPVKVLLNSHNCCIPLIFESSEGMVPVRPVAAEMDKLSSVVASPISDGMLPVRPGFLSSHISKIFGMSPTKEMSPVN